MQLNLFDMTPASRQPAPVKTPAPGRFSTKYRKGKDIVDGWSYDIKPMVKTLHDQAKKLNCDVVELHDEQKPKIFARWTWTGKAWSSSVELTPAKPLIERLSAPAPVAKPSTILAPLPTGKTCVSCNAEIRAENERKAKLAVKPVAIPTKDCPRCKTAKPMTEFGQRKNSKGEAIPQSWCKKCRA